MANEKINLHTHSAFSDGKNSTEEIILAAIEKGFTVLGFSDHCFYPLNPDFYSSKDSCWHLTPGKLKESVKTINELKEKYKDQIKILLGFEADYFTAASVGRAIPDKKCYGGFAPDFLIGSVHFVNTKKGYYSVDNTAQEVLKNLKLFYSDSNGNIDGKAAVCDYFEAERQMLRAGIFEIIAHPDLIRIRNKELNFFDENESWYLEQIKLTAQSIARAGVIAEINTGAYARGIMEDVYPSDKFLEYLAQSRVPVCINTDAHTIENLDFGYDFAAEKARRAGYKELTYPIDGQLVHIKL